MAHLPFARQSFAHLSFIRATGFFVITLVVLSIVPYLNLIATFDYDDILREPVEVVLTQFQAGGTSLIMTWFVFGLSALLLVPLTWLLFVALNRSDTPYLGAATVMGSLSGLVQAVGLMRWVFVIPILAQSYEDPSLDVAHRAAVEVAYQVLNQYGGVAIGEHLGQTLMVGWTLGLGVAMLRSPWIPVWVGWWGLATVPLLLVGQSELLATSIPGFPVLELTPIGFTLWEVWLLLVGGSLVWRNPKASSSESLSEPRG